MTTARSLTVLSVASEVFPLVKTGGLADVVGALPAALAPEDIDVRTLVPGYPAVLKALGEDVAPMSALDRFARLEQLGWLASADEWQTLSQIRNQFAHDYPNNALERFERLQAAIGAATQLMSVLTYFQSKNKSQMTG